MKKKGLTGFAITVIAAVMVIKKTRVMKTKILNCFFASILLFSLGCSNDAEGITEEETTFSNEMDEFNDVGYIVDTYSCTNGFKGYYIISENLKDTLISFNLPDVYKCPLIFYDEERPGYSYRYEYKIEFVYREAEREDAQICVAMYYERYPYARQIVIKSASKYGNPDMGGCEY